MSSSLKTLLLALEKNEHSTASMVSNTTSSSLTLVVEYTYKGQENKGCLVHIEIIEFNLYPQYSVKSMIYLRKRSEVSMKTQRKALSSNEAPQVVHKYFVSLPTEEAHHKCHLTKGVMGLSQRVHAELIAKIYELVSTGTVEPVEVQWHHLNHYMCAGNLPDPNDRAYFPSLSRISDSSRIVAI